MRARASFNGGRPNARSLNTSAPTPPMPTIITKPKIGSFFVPMINSKLFGYVTIFCTVTPTMSAWAASFWPVLVMH